MTSQCKVCQHPERAKIELGIARKVPARLLAKKFGTSPYSVHRHGRSHMPPQLRASLLTASTPSAIDLDALRKSESEGLLQHLVAQRGQLYALIEQAGELGDLRACASLHARVTETIALAAKLLGDIQTGSVTTVNNLIVAPEYLDLRSRLVSALRPHPEAAQAVAKVLRSVEEQGPPKVIEHRGHGGHGHA